MSYLEGRLTVGKYMFILIVWSVLMIGMPLAITSWASRLNVVELSVELSRLVALLL
jgi:hypothetical protein